MRRLVLLLALGVPTTALPVASAENCEGYVCADVLVRAYHIGDWAYDAVGRATSSFLPVEGTLTLAPGGEDACADVATCTMFVAHPVPYPIPHCHVAVATASNSLDTIADSQIKHC